jgi:stearoyl-CoA desaturase (delta-9 desaturase)
MSALLAEPEIRGTVRLDARQLRVQRRITLLMTAAPVAGVALAVWSFWGRGVHIAALTIAAAFYVVTGLGISVGFHRLFTHRSFTAVRPLRVALAIAGSMAVEGSVVSWTATHRRHHAYADEYGDPHSPHLALAPGIRGVLLGLYHAHMGWLFDARKSEATEWAPDLLADPAIVRVDRWFPRLTLLTFALPALAGLLVTRSWNGMLWAFAWGSLARIFLLHHVTWSINSVCHFYGREAFRARDESRNVWPLSFVSFGEAWHNNHHAFPWSARLGLRAWEVDPGWYVLRAFRWLRMVSNVKVPTRTQMAAKRIR